MSQALKQDIKEPSLQQQSDVDLLLTTLTNTPSKSYPYRHWMVGTLFSEEVVDQLVELPFRHYNLDYQLGTREEHNPTRTYINQEAVEEFPVAKRVADIFLNRQIITKFEEMGGMSLQGSLLRMEYAMDSQEFWLTPHTDIGVKLFTMLIYLSTGKNSETWGTDIYENAETHAMAVPYNRNSALMFIPSQHTWHGFERRYIDGLRKSLIVNYVTQEWRNRHELVHPTEAVY